MDYLIKAPKKTAAISNRERNVDGAIIMLGTLIGLIALVYWLVLRYDPEARRPSRRAVDQR